MHKKEAANKMNSQNIVDYENDDQEDIEASNAAAVANNAHIESDGVVQESIRGVVTVMLTSGQVIKCHLSGKMKMNKIRLLPGDNVLLKLSPFDLERGIVTRRVK